TSLLSLTAPLVMGVLGKRASAQGLDASGLANSLLSEKAEIAAAAPSGLSQLLGTDGPSVVSRVKEPVAQATSYATARRDYAEPRRTGLGRWLPLLLIALGILALLSFLRGRTPRAGVDGALTTVTLPGGASVSVPAGSVNYDLARFLGDTS